MQRWLAFHPISPSGCCRCGILQLGLCFKHRGTTTSRHSWHSCTGWRCWSASSLSWLFWYTDAYTSDSSAVPRSGIPPVICWRGSSASSLCIDIIACCPTHPSFNHRRSSFSGRCFPTVEHSAAERQVGVVNSCFQETFEDPSLQSFFPRVISDNIIDRFTFTLQMYIKSTFSSRLHTRSDIHSIAEETVSWHSVSHHSCIRSAQTQGNRLNCSVHFTLICTVES